MWLMWKWAAGFASLFSQLELQVHASSLAFLCGLWGIRTQIPVFVQQTPHKLSRVPSPAAYSFSNNSCLCWPQGSKCLISVQGLFFHAHSLSSLYNRCLWQNTLKCLVIWCTPQIFDISMSLGISFSACLLLGLQTGYHPHLTSIYMSIGGLNSHPQDWAASSLFPEPSSQMPFDSFLTGCLVFLLSTFQSSSGVSDSPLAFNCSTIFSKQ